MGQLIQISDHCRFRTRSQRDAEKFLQPLDLTDPDSFLDLCETPLHPMPELELEDIFFDDDADIPGTVFHEDSGSAAMWADRQRYYESTFCFEDTSR